jgi:hypothetical protein
MLTVLALSASLANAAQKGKVQKTVATQQEHFRIGYWSHFAVTNKKRPERAVCPGRRYSVLAEAIFGFVTVMAFQSQSGRFFTLKSALFRPQNRHLPFSVHAWPPSERMRFMLGLMAIHDSWSSAL